MKLSLTIKLIGSFIIIVIITGFVGIMGYVGIQKTTKDVQQLGNVALPTVNNLEIIKVKFLELKVAIRTLTSPYATANDVKLQFENIDKARAGYKEAVAAYEKLETSSEQKELYTKMLTAIDVARKHNDILIEKAKEMLDSDTDRQELSKELSRDAMAGEVRDGFENLINAIDKVIDYANQHYSVELVKRANADGIMSRAIILISSVVGSIVALLIGFFMSASISKPVNKISGELSTSAGNLESAAGQVSSSSQELSSGASELASSVEEMTSSIEELQSIIESNSKNINEGELMMRETMTGTKVAVDQMSNLKISHEEIRDNSKKIEKIIKVIDDIAFQTNILALNAAVEAARAGEAGRGFAVVADQVKNLAQKSADAAKETSSLIETSITAVSKGYDLGENVGDSLNKAADLASKVATILDEVNKASKEQLKGAIQVTKAISQINTVVQQTASSSEETAAAGEELLSQAEVTKTIVNRLNILVKGSTGKTNYSQQDNTTADHRQIKQIEHIKGLPHNVQSSNTVSNMDHQIAQNSSFNDPEKQIPFDEF